MERQITKKKKKKKKKKISDDQSTSRAHSDPIPLDLIPDILKALPVKTLARFLCVSKQWESIIRNRDFMKSYLIKSSTRPQGLFFTFQSKRYGKNFFFSACHPQNRGESSSSLATYHMKCHSQPYTTVAPSVHGLFCYGPTSNNQGESSSFLATYHMKCHSRPYATVAPSVHGLICYGPPCKLMVYNPSTRRSITLPKIDSQRIDMHHYLGYDPIDDDYKVLCMTIRGRVGLAQELLVLTLGNGNSWRAIEDCPPHLLEYPDSPDICIDGVLYYPALVELNEDLIHAVMSFDVRSEKIDLIKVPKGAYHLKLTNYKGKLALLFNGFSESKINLWILEDAAKHEWSKKLYVLPIIQGQNYCFFHPVCATNEGELVLAQSSMPAVESFYVLYYDPEKNTVRRVYIEGLAQELPLLWEKESEHGKMFVVSGQVDNLMFL